MGRDEARLLLPWKYGDVEAINGWRLTTSEPWSESVLQLGFNPPADNAGIKVGTLPDELKRRKVKNSVTKSTGPASALS